MSGPLTLTAWEIRIAARRATRPAVRRLLEDTDRLVAQLESLNLQDIKEVPESIGPQLARIRTQVVQRYPTARAITAGLRMDIMVADLLDGVFDAQALCLASLSGAPAAAPPSNTCHVTRAPGTRREPQPYALTSRRS
jgi:hypothetical protein